MEFGEAQSKVRRANEQLKQRAQCGLVNLPGKQRQQVAHHQLQTELKQLPGLPGPMSTGKCSKT